MADSGIIITSTPPPSFWQMGKWAKLKIHSDEFFHFSHSIAVWNKFQPKLLLMSTRTLSGRFQKQIRSLNALFLLRSLCELTVVPCLCLWTASPPQTSIFCRGEWIGRRETVSGGLQAAGGRRESILFFFSPVSDCLFFCVRVSHERVSIFSQASLPVSSSSHVPQHLFWLDCDLI